MGAAMAGHLLDHGYSLTVHNRTRKKAEPLIARGACWASTPAEAAAGAEMVISIVGFPHDVEATHLGGHGTLTADPLPSVIIDMTTSNPSLAVRLAEAAGEKGISFIDAPVSGGDVGAKNATLSIMVGGDKQSVSYVQPILQCMGNNIVHQGGPGTGQHTKMVNQILIASNMVGVCEGLIYADRAGLDPMRVIESVSKGAAGSWSIDNLGPRMIQRDFSPGFFVEHFIKDLQIALDEAARMNLALPGLALARQLYQAVSALGHHRSGTQALLLALEQLNGKYASAASSL